MGWLTVFPIPPKSRTVSWHEPIERDVTEWYAEQFEWEWEESAYEDFASDAQVVDQAEEEGWQEVRRSEWNDSGTTTKDVKRKEAALFIYRSFS